MFITNARDILTPQQYITITDDKLAHKLEELGFSILSITEDGDFLFTKTNEIIEVLK